MVTETVSLDELQATNTRLEADLAKAAKSGDMEKVLELSTQVSKSRTAVLKAQKETNKEAIEAAENTLLDGMKVLVDNLGWKDITGEDIHTVIFYKDESAESDGNGPVFGIRINAKRKGGGGGGTRSGTKASVKMMREVDGKTEVLTVKEIVQTYGNDDNTSKSLVDKKAWSILFPRVNKSLDVPFVEAPAEQAAEEESTE